MWWGGPSHCSTLQDGMAFLGAHHGVLAWCMMTHVQCPDAGSMIVVWQVAKRVVCHAALAELIAALRSGSSTWLEIDSTAEAFISPDYIEKSRRSFLRLIHKKAEEGQGVRKV